jgi:ketosteroid isomerase-like protein
MPTQDDLDKLVERYHLALDAFARGDPGPVKELFSHGDDVVLANPFGPAVRGWTTAAQHMDAAAGKYRDGACRRFDRLAAYVAPELACLYELEHWQARIGDRKEITEFQLRTTTTVRREGGAWKIAHRHADPIATASADGPLRSSFDR